MLLLAHLCEWSTTSRRSDIKAELKNGWADLADGLTRRMRLDH